MDAIFDRGLVPFSVQPWWVEFILNVQDNQNATSYLKEPPTTAAPPKTLYWALNTALELLDVAGNKYYDLIYGDLILHFRLYKLQRYTKKKSFWSL